MLQTYPVWYPVILQANYDQLENIIIVLWYWYFFFYLGTDNLNVCYSY